MSWRLGPALLVLLLLVSVAPAQPLRTSPSEILAQSDRFDGQTVTLSGSMTALRETVSRRGNPYYTFDLSDGRVAVRVFSFGSPPCQSGAVAADGRFEKVKRVGRYTFRNEVTATSVTCH